MERCERSLAYFLKQGWHVIEPATDYLHNWHIDLVAEHLEAVTAGEISRLVVNIPPRYMKSIEITVMWPCWEWGPRGMPYLRYLFASYSAGLSTDHSRSRRLVIESEWYRSMWPGVTLVGDQNVKTEYENTSRGKMISTSVGGTATGKGGNRVIIDDPVNPEDSYSETKRESANNYFDRTLATRLDDKKRDAIVLVMQRIHDDDLTGHILEKANEQGGDQWVHLKVPALEDKTTVVHFPRSGRDLTRQPDEPLWEEREGHAELNAMKVSMGSSDFSAQYLQDPVPPGGNMFKESWWRYWRELPGDLFDWMQSWDMTFKDSEGTDFVVGQVWARRSSAPAQKYLIDQVRGRWDFPTTVTMVVGLSSKWPQAYLKLVEDKANGPAIIAQLQGQIGGFVAVEPQGGKIARAAAATPSVEAGNVYLPDPSQAGWVADYILEHARFPKGANDDQVDCTSQALARMNLPVIGAVEVV